jgi:DNA-binding PadR family transcriptional regulator
MAEFDHFGLEKTGAATGLPYSIIQYLAHVQGGISIRDLARREDMHASTLSRRFRRVELQRDDPLFDAGLKRLEATFDGTAPEFRQILLKDLEPKDRTSNLQGDVMTSENLSQDELRILRRMCESGAVLAVAKDMDMAVVVRESSEGGTTRTAVASQQVAQDLALRGWIETSNAGRILRYTVTPAGREALTNALGALPEAAPCAQSQGLAEAAGQFMGATKVWGERTIRDDMGQPRKVRYNLADSPLTALARRRDKTGQPFLDEALVRCGERLREDFELAQMSTQVSEHWDAYVSGRIDHGDPAAKGYGPEAAQARVVAVLKELGPGLSDVVLRCCCFLEGLESAEQQLGWSARSGKIVLRIALQQLKRHYDATLTTESQLIG